MGASRTASTAARQVPKDRTDRRCHGRTEARRQQQEDRAARNQGRRPAGTRLVERARQVDTRATAQGPALVSHLRRRFSRRIRILERSAGRARRHRALSAANHQQCRERRRTGLTHQQRKLRWLHGERWPRAIGRLSNHRRRSHIFAPFCSWRTARIPDRLSYARDQQLSLPDGRRHRARARPHTSDRDQLPEREFSQRHVEPHFTHAHADELRRDLALR